MTKTYRVGAEPVTGFSPLHQDTFTLMMMHGSFAPIAAQLAVYVEDPENGVYYDRFIRLFITSSPHARRSLLFEAMRGERPPVASGASSGGPSAGPKAPSASDGPIVGPATPADSPAKPAAPATPTTDPIVTAWEAIQPPLADRVVDVAWESGLPNEDSLKDAWATAVLYALAAGGDDGIQGAKLKLSDLAMRALTSSSYVMNDTPSRVFFEIAAKTATLLLNSVGSVEAAGRTTAPHLTPDPDGEGFYFEDDQLDDVLDVLNTDLDQGEWAAIAHAVADARAISDARTVVDARLSASRLTVPEEARALYDGTIARSWDLLALDIEASDHALDLSTKDGELLGVASVAATADIVIGVTELIIALVDWYQKTYQASTAKKNPKGQVSEPIPNESQPPSAQAAEPDHFEVEAGPQLGSISNLREFGSAVAQFRRSK